MTIDIKFTKHWGAYNIGEIARFDSELGQALLLRGVAVEYHAETLLESNKVNQVIEESQENPLVVNNPETVNVPTISADKPSGKAK